MKFNAKHSSGFSLIEIMVTIAIIGILTTVASRAYDSQKRKGYRMDAISAVSLLAQREENWHSRNGAYTITITDVGSAISKEKKYNLSLSNIGSDTYTITAEATGSQLEDKDCRKFILEHTGRKTAEKDDTSANTKCWPK